MAGFRPTFIYGLTIFVLVILAGLLTGIFSAPIAIVMFLLNSPAWPLMIIVFIISIFMLGWVFMRFKVQARN